jgi:ribonucleoside-diphosphate reductase alpha chain
MQFDDTIHGWHTCKGTDRQHSTNPCSEYLFLNNTACNLASLNLMKFKKADGSFDVERFKAAVRVFITAQEILVDNASYPTAPIAENSHIFRTLGLGYANLGSLIMSYGKGYDSRRRPRPRRRDHLAHDRHRLRSQRRDRRRDRPVPRLPRRALRRRRKAARARQRRADARSHRAHLKACADIDSTAPALHPHRRRQGVGNALAKARKARLPQRAGHRPRAHRHHRLPHGLRHHRHRARHRAGEVQAPRRRRHAQDRQPDRARRAQGTRLQRRRSTEIVDYIDKNDTIEGAPHLKEEHVSVFDCAFRPPTASARSTTAPTSR